MNILIDGLGDPGLLLGSTGNLDVHLVDGTNSQINFLQRFIYLTGFHGCRLTDCTNQLHSVACAGLQPFNRLLNFLGTLLSPACQCANFICDHRKASTSFAGAIKGI
jgi:hypothetical protein